MRPSQVWLIAASLGVAACRFDPDHVGGYQCGLDDSCPSGFMCVDGFCLSEAPDAAPGDGSPDAEPGTARCGGLGLLQDEFSDSTRDPQWDFFEDPGATLSETGGHLAIAIAAGTESSYAGYISAYRYDLTGGTITAEVSSIGGRDTILEVRNYLGERVQLVSEAGELVAGVFDVVGEGTRAAIPYDADDHRWWRFREDDGTLFWEFSADGDAWTELHSEANPIELTHVRGVVSAGEQETTASEARFEVINPDDPSVGFCAASTLIDPFDGPLQPNWEFWEDAGCDLTVTGGHVQMAYSTGVGSSFCGLGSNHLYDVTAGGVYMDSQGNASATTFVNYFQVINPADEEYRAEIGRELDSIGFGQRINGIDVNQAYETFDATDDRYWKIAASGANLLLQTSPDASTWTTRMNVPAQFDLTKVRIVIGAGHYPPGPGTPQTTLFQGLNTP